MSTIKPKGQYDSTFSIAYDILLKHYELEEKLASNELNIGASCNCDNTNMLNALMDIKTVLENKECGCKETIIEKPVIVEKPVEKIVYKEKVVEKPVVKEKTVYKAVEKVIYKYIKDNKVVQTETRTNYSNNNCNCACGNKTERKRVIPKEPVQEKHTIEKIIKQMTPTMIIYQRIA